MIYTYFTASATYGIGILLYMTAALAVFGLLCAWLHRVVQNAVCHRPVTGSFKAVLREPETWISVACLCVFGVLWHKTAEPLPEKRGKRFLTALVGVAVPFCVSIVAFFLIRLCVAGQLTFLIYLFKALFRAGAYSAIFSLLPLLPYDGGTLLLSVLPERLQEFFAKSKEISLVVMLALILTLTVLGKIPQMVL